MAMADNTTLSLGAEDGDTVRSKDRGGVKTTVVLLDVGGVSGSESVLGDEGVTMPIAGVVALHTTDRDMLSAIATSLGALDNAVGGNELQVDIVSAPTLTVNAHAVTNGGTFVVQENGAALTALQVMDDWDESDRAKVNLIAGQAGISAGAGNVAANSPRITLAADDPAVVALGALSATAGGWTPYRNIDVDETEDDIKTSAGRLGWLHVMNMSAGVLYLKIYNGTAASVTVGTTTPVLTFPIPTLEDTNGAGFCISFGDVGLAFSTAISVAATTDLAEDGSPGAPGANEVILNAGYI